jgi:hypothetical protein
VGVAVGVEVGVGNAVGVGGTGVGVGGESSSESNSVLAGEHAVAASTDPTAMQCRNRFRLRPGVEDGACVMGSREGRWSTDGMPGTSLIGADANGEWTFDRVVALHGDDGGVDAPATAQGVRRYQRQLAEKPKRWRTKAAGQIPSPA